MSNIEKMVLSRRLRTPLKREEVEEALERNAIASEVFYRIEKHSFRTERGERLFDMIYDTETTDKKFEFKTKNNEHFVIDLKDLEHQFRDMEQAM